MANWAREAPEFGICHTDLAGCNIRWDSVHGIVLFDFGDAKYTWRVSDVGWFYAGDSCSPERQQRWDAFRRGYSVVRALPGHLCETHRLLRLMGHLRSLGRASASCQLRMGMESPERFMPRDIESLREQVRAIPELRGRLKACRLL